jgi:hypothetical protein
MFGFDLGRKFLSVPLPKSALAEYLGLALPTLCKAISPKYRRMLTPREAISAAAFFSVVPTSANPNFLQAVQKLRSRRARARASRGLSELDRGSSVPEGVENLLTRAAKGELLRADQIVALCVCGGIDLPALVATGKAHFDPRLPPARRHAPFAPFQSAAAEWAHTAGAPEPYRLEGGEASRPTVIPAVATDRSRHASLMRRSDAEVLDASGLVGYVVADRSLAPKFEEGDTVFLGEAEAARSGDLVAAIAERGVNRVLVASVGRLVFKSDNAIALRLPSGERIELAVNEVQELRRIAAVAF